MSVKDEVLRYFLEKGEIPGCNEEEHLQCNYVQMKLLSSLNIVEMVVYFEGLYNIYFSDKDVGSDGFQTIGGLIDLIEHLRKK